MSVQRVPLRVIVAQWGRIGCIGFGGPPAHISLLRKLCVTRRGWLTATEFEDGVAAANLLPGPASTQLAIFCAWRVAGPVGALVGGACFILPGLAVILGLAGLFLATRPPLWVAGASAGAGAAVPAVAASAAISLMPASWRRVRPAGSDPARIQQARRKPGQPPGADQRRTSPRLGWSRPGWLRPGWLRLGWSRLGWLRLSWSRPGWPQVRWLGYLAVGAVVGALAGQFLALVLAACGLLELAVRTGGVSQPGPLPDPAIEPGIASGPGGAAGGGESAGPGGQGGPHRGRPGLPGAMLPLAIGVPAVAGGLLALAWVALKVGALSYGGGFVIIPLMQRDAVHTYHWMTGAQFLSAVALGQVTPGPVVQTVAVVGYAAAGVGGGMLAALIAFAPSFAFVLAGAPRFASLRGNARVQAFLTGAGPAAIGAIAGSTIPLALDVTHLWQAAILGVAAVWLLGLRRNVVVAIIGAAGLGVIAVLAGAPLG